jgi:pSer/pThr/pTyr-binding forkhead associated (FHA) protein
MDEGSAPNPMPMAQPQQPMMQAPRARLSMTLIRPDGSEGGTHDLRPGENKLGRSFGPVFENDGYLSPVHAMLDIRGPTGIVRDLDSLNGVFVKMTGEEELQSGQIIRIGQELLRYEVIPTPEPTADGTELMGSPNPGFWGKLTVIIGRDITGAAFPLLGESVTLGRERGEINFPDDGYVSGLHARVTLRDGRVFLADLGSSNGTFVKVNGERGVGHDSFVLLGQQLFRLNLAWLRIPVPLPYPLFAAPAERLTPAGRHGRVSPVRRPSPVASRSPSAWRRFSAEQHDHLSTLRR